MDTHARNRLFCHTSTRATRTTRPARPLVPRCSPRTLLAASMLVLLSCSAGIAVAQDAAYVDSAAGRSMPDPASADRSAVPSDLPDPPADNSPPSLGPGTALPPNPATAGPDAAPAPLPSGPEAQYLQQLQMAMQAGQTARPAGAAVPSQMPQMQQMSQPAAAVAAQQGMMLPGRAGDFQADAQDPYPHDPDARDPYEYAARQNAAAAAALMQPGSDTPMDTSASALARTIGNGLIQDAGQAVGDRIQREIRGDNYRHLPTYRQEYPAPEPEH